MVEASKNSAEIFDALKESQFDGTSACPLSEAASDQISQNKAVQSAQRDDGEDELITDLWFISNDSWVGLSVCILLNDRLWQIHINLYFYIFIANTR